ncbi:MAG: cupin domain-containing protein [Candidatus Heimdallarchaeota archaeon]|nr:cupin domain-containing protein [Candidatus Heimdallarchaeota archaeon]
MEDQVFYLNSKPWIPNDNTSVGKSKVLLDSSMTKSGSLKLMQLAPKEKFNSHEHAYLHLMYFTSGNGILIIDSNEFEIKPGLTAIVLPNQCHTVANTGDDNMEIMVFETYDLNDTDTPFVDF